LASNALQCPITLVYRFGPAVVQKPAVGLAQNEIPRNDLFCAAVIERTTRDSGYHHGQTVSKNPLVTGAATLHSLYAGAPICTYTGRDWDGHGV
jgi:hypothetical protein